MNSLPEEQFVFLMNFKELSSFSGPYLSKVLSSGSLV